MAKQSGLGAAFFHDGYDVTTDIKSVENIGQASAMLDKTSIDKSAAVRIYGRRDGVMTVTAHFDDAAGFSHPIFSALPKVDVQQMYCHRSALGAPAAAHIGHQTNYDPTRDAAGDLVSAVEVVSDNFPIEWGLLHSIGKVNSTGAQDIGAFDHATTAYPADTEFGLAAYLFVFAFTGTDATITLEQSEDNGSGDAFATVTGGAFAQITTAPVVERIETSLTQNTEKDIQLAITTSGGFSSMDYAVMVIRYEGADRNNGAST